MGSGQFKARGLTAIAHDILEGYLSLNPLFVKRLANEEVQALITELRKCQRLVRVERFPFHDQAGMRQRAMRLQRLHQAVTVLEHITRERRMLLV